MQNKYSIRGWLCTLIFIMISAPAYSATLNLTTKYGATGGLRGNLNSVGDEVNGRDICPVANTNANGTPGCDMSADPGYVAGVNTPVDDSYTGDLVVRTNDNFELIAAWSWLGNAGEDEITLTSTLPLGTNFIFDGIPGACDAILSTLSADQKTINCVRTGFDTNDVGSYAEDFAFAVRVEGDAVNGGMPGPLSITISDTAATTAPVVDGTETTSLVITASPRWNIDKSQAFGLYTVHAGQQDDLGNPGWIIWYNFSIEVDEVTGETDSLTNPALGNEALAGGTNATVTFTDDLSSISLNARLVTWDTRTQFTPITNACDMDSNYSNDNEPFTVFNATNPNRSIQVASGVMNVTCTQTGSSVAVTVTGIDGTLTNAPTHNRAGNLLPVNRNIAAIGVIRVFVPLSDVVTAGGSLATTNCVTDFNPDGISGGSNFGGNTESEMDNCRSLTLNAVAGNWDKNYRNGWSDRAAERPKWGGGGWWLPPTDAALVEGGFGTVTAGGVWGTYTSFVNSGGTPFTNMTICDVIDVETYEMTVIDPANDYGTAGAGILDQSIHPVDLLHSNTENNAGLTIEYATGYVIASWPPDPLTSPGASAPDEVVDECSDPSITWHTTMAAAETAAAGDPVSKVRISVSSLEPGMRMSMRIKHTARDTFLTSGATIPADTLLINHATYTRDGLTGTAGLDGRTWRGGDYIALDASQPPPNGGGGDRLIMVTAKARILKAMGPASVSPGTETTVTLSPSFTTDGTVSVPGTVVIADLLPDGMNYNFGSTTGTFGTGPTPYGEPLVINPTTDADCTTHVPDIVAEGFPCGDTLNGGDTDTTILVWDLGVQQTGMAMDDLVFNGTVAIDADPIILQNYAQISSSADTSPSSQRVANANTSNTVPTSLLIVKSVLTPLNEINSTTAPNNWMDFQIGLRNGAAIGVTDLDFIDILPFNGDGVMGSFTFTPAPGTTVPRNRTPASNFSGTLEFDSVSFDDNGGTCDVNTLEFWYTRNAGPLDISPKNTVLNDTAAGTSNWCQGTATGPGGCDGGDGAITNADVTAFRIIGPDFAPSATCFVNVTYATAGMNVDADIYSNTAGAEVQGVTNAVLSNTVSAVVFAGSIGDTIWFDANNDGLLDAGEGLGGITVTITPPAGIDLGAGPGVPITTVTLPDGTYLFPNLPAGSYTITVDESTLPVPLQGNNTVDPDGGNDSTSVHVLGADEDNLDQDFAYFVASGITIDKTVYVGHDAGASCPGGELAQGPNPTDVTYCFVVTNTGGTHLDSINVTDGTIGIVHANLTLVSGTLPLAPGASVTYFFDGTLTADLVNTASVTANPTDENGVDLPNGVDPTDDDTAEVSILTPAVDLQKTVYLGHDGGASCPGGELSVGASATAVTYCFVVTNTGDSHLDAVDITDAAIGVTQANLTLIAGSLPLAPGGSISYFFNATITADLVNTASVSANPVDNMGNDLPGLTDPTDSDTAEVDLVGPGVDLIKTVYEGHDLGVSCAGTNTLDIYGTTDVTYCFTVTNTGDTFLDDILLNDTTLGITDASMTLLSGVTPLAPAATLVFFFETTQSDNIVNTVDVIANPVDNMGNDLPGLPDVTGDDDATVNLLVPEMELVKSVYVGHDNGVSCPGSNIVTLNDAADVTFCFVVTNTGAVDLDNVAINDVTLGVTDAAMVLVSGSSPLAPGATMVWAYETTLANSVNNVAQATANPIDPAGNDIPVLIDEEAEGNAVVNIIRMIPTLNTISIAIIMLLLLITGYFSRRRIYNV
ncbi:MAG: hypothetical protein L3J53_01645 [Proteobacteria bacterium]|nr:hypothetical protein [Pseudomonadota bacterium]